MSGGQGGPGNPIFPVIIETSLLGRSFPFAPFTFLPVWRSGGLQLLPITDHGHSVIRACRADILRLGGYLTM